MTYWQCYYHLIWSTKGRLPVIDEAAEQILHRIIPGIAREDGAMTHAIGIMPDHVHVAISIPPRVSVSAAVNRMKGSSRHMLTHEFKNEHPNWIGWQAEYGAVSFGERSLPDVVDYVMNQKDRHAQDRLLPVFEREERERSSPT